MNARYYVEKALKEAKKNPGKAGDILVRHFQQAIDYTIQEAGEAFRGILDEASDLEDAKRRLSGEEDPILDSEVKEQFANASQ